MACFIQLHILVVFFLVGVIFSESETSSSAKDWYYDDHYIFPTSVPHFPVRFDPLTKEPVSRGRFELLNNTVPWLLQYKDASKVSVQKFREVLQYAATEPAISGRRGIIETMRLLPPTRETIKVFCACIDSRANEGVPFKSWSECRKIAKFQDENPGKFCRKERGERNMLRIINSKLHTDWPWCVENNGAADKTDGGLSTILHHYIDYVNDAKNAFMIFGGENPRIPSHFPVPFASNSPHVTTADIPWPWFQNILSEFRSYAHSWHNNKNFSEEIYRREVNPTFKKWEDRTEKALYFGDLTLMRHIFMDQAILRPDLIEARWKCDACRAEPWNPVSYKEKGKFLDMYKRNADQKPSLLYKEGNWNMSGAALLDKSKVGFLSPLSHIHISGRASVPIGHYKYIAILTGLNGYATADRFAAQLAHSGAVMLLQENGFEYHFSGRLKPWVHYVPLSYNAADVVAKVEWLRAHDDMARQIAENARNFGLSYLRLEDIYCYVSTVMETMAEIQNTTDAKLPFKPKYLRAIKRSRL